ncbi:M20 family metallopeptidase [Brevibacillus humidisoli]|uniref:M20 metallopeptidase family protein n=1 Tax=Brevibacillus humidisoli TaxID=2895522 RepID=UPI001E32E92A|nr:M20 family metallopeptidase [Brevibacillus humidisoli]UFJ42607.1 M20 family metallopeptidase [Brevibacillus humidisoli]
MEDVAALYRSSAILTEASALKEQVTAWRRDFHRHPELGLEEERTAEVIAAHLRRLGLEVKQGLARTGVVGVLRGSNPGRTIGLRADMDALPIQDQKQTSYRSTIDGKMHACGHDAHTSMLMGAATFLAKMRPPERGNIVFVFQPAEENHGGARLMIEDGLLRDYGIEAMAGLHVFPGVPTGEITAVRGVSCAAADTLFIRIIGSGGHAARPHQSVDAVAVAAQVITALQHITSRQVDPLDSVVITIGKIEGGTASNVIAPEVNLWGTVRTLNPALREQLPQQIERMVKGVTEANGAAYELEYQQGYPSVVNDVSMIDLLLEVADDVLGRGKYRMDRPSMGGEDFSYYTQHVPSVFFRLGVGDEQHARYPLHHPMFDLDEDALPIGVALLSKLALTYLGKS